MTAWRYYTMSNSEVLWAIKDLYGITDRISDLQLLRSERKVRTDASEQTWAVPDDWDLT